jgi:hypothetical protein
MTFMWEIRMAKRPENMTPEERLTRIRSLERKVSDLEWRLQWSESEQTCTTNWARSAFEENRRLTDRLGELIARVPQVLDA